MNPLRQCALSRPALKPIFIEHDENALHLNQQRQPNLSPPVSDAMHILRNATRKTMHRKGDNGNNCDNCEIPLTAKRFHLVHHSCRHALCGNCYMLAYFQVETRQYCALIYLHEYHKNLLVSLPHQRVEKGHRLTWSGPPPCDSSTELDVFEPDKSDGHRPGAVNPDRVGVLVGGKFITNEELFAQRETRERASVWGTLNPGELDPATARLYSQSELEGYVQVKMFLAFEDAVARCIRDEGDKAKQEMRNEMQIIAACVTSAAELSNPGQEIPEGQKVKEKSSEKSSTLEPGMCVICLSETSTHATTPCGHLCMCQSCSAKLTDNKCPVCRSYIVSTIRIHDSGAPNSNPTSYDRELTPNEITTWQVGTGRSVMFPGKS